MKELKTTEIVAFSTIALKGAVRDVGRALNIPLHEVSEICDSLILDEKKDFIAPEKLKNKYRELFRFADLLNGVIVTCGTHPAGILISSNNIEEEIGTFTIKGTKYPVSCLDMYGLDANSYVKFDMLGLDNVGLINETCKLAEIDRITPDNINLEDMDVWKDISNDTTAIFQFESPYAYQTLKQFFSDDVLFKIKEKLPGVPMMKLFSFCNALIRPCGASVRESVLNGEIKRTGIKDIDDLLAPELGNCIIQESFMQFVMKFCGYSLRESDNLRKGIAKKKGTEQFLADIHDKFIEISGKKYNLTIKQCEDIVNPIIKCIEDATRYAFSWNHSDAYSFIGYACGYLRHYYPLEFIATCLNVWRDKEEKTVAITEYASKNKIRILSPKFRHSKSNYYISRHENAVYKGLSSIKYLSESSADELYALKDNKYPTFTSLLYDILEKTTLNTRQLEILIRLDFFSEFGNAKELMRIYTIFSEFNNGKQKQIAKSKVKNDVLINIIERNCRQTEKSYLELNITKILDEVEEYVKALNLPDFTIRDKMADQKEYLGYIDFSTGKPEDRFKLIVTEITALFTKDKEKCWARRINAVSLGTGKKQELTIYEKYFSKNQLIVGDCIQTNPNNFFVKKWNDRDYWYLTAYNIIK